MYRALYRTFLRPAFEHGPTAAHKALARLEEMGKLQGIITTNEDYEIWKQGHMPKCPECGGMMLPYDLYSRAGLWEPAVRKAQEWIGQADLILVIGTNGYYGSVYWNRRKRIAGIIQINPGRTNFDRVADLNIHEEADPVFEKLMRLEEKAV